MNRYYKIFPRIKMIVREFFEKWHHYSFKLGVYNTAVWLGFYLTPCAKWARWGNKKIYAMMDETLSGAEIYRSVVDRLVRSQSAECLPRVKRSDFTIWIFWWQGEEQMPPLVRGCYRQLTKSNPERVVLLTKDNLNDYCTIPGYIMDKVKRGLITFTHLSDIVRITLLAEQGGMWLDSTCWVSGTLPDEVYNTPFYSPHTKAWQDSRWCSWAVGTCLIGNPIHVFMRDVLHIWLLHHDTMPFYLFQDYLYDYTYRHSAICRTIIDSNPDNNNRRNDLHFLLNSPWNADKYADLITNDWLFKLSYKSRWLVQTPQGEETFFAHLLLINNDQ